MAGIVAPSGYPDELTKYAKMLKMGVPESAVRGKMFSDGFDDDMFDKYLNPDTAITANQEEDDDDDDDEEKEIDLLDPDQAEQAPDQPPQQQSSQPTGFFLSQNFVPAADSELKMDVLAPVPVKKTFLIVNTFVVNTASFLNSFVTACESKLHKIHTDIQRMETTMLLLENKLSSIDWVREAEQGKAPVLPAADSWETTKFEEQKHDNNEQKMDGGGDDNGPPPEPEKPAEDPLLSDPEMAPWFKMLKFGVPESAVRLKMSLSGCDDATVDRVVQIHHSR
eukprot:176186_1